MRGRGAFAGRASARARAQEHAAWEEAFRVYERGVALFRYPHVKDIWAAYLAQFVARYKGTKLERARDLFRQALDQARGRPGPSAPPAPSQRPCRHHGDMRAGQGVAMRFCLPAAAARLLRLGRPDGARCARPQAPPAEARPLFLQFAALEENHGLARAAMDVYDRAVRTLPEPERLAVYELYLAKASEFFGIKKARPRGACRRRGSCAGPAPGASSQGAGAGRPARAAQAPAGAARGRGARAPAGADALRRARQVREIYETAIEAAEPYHLPDVDCLKMCTRRAPARAAPAAWPAAARLNSVCRCRGGMPVCVGPGPAPLLAAGGCFAPGRGAPASARAHDRGGCRALGGVYTRARVRRRYAALERRLGEVDRARAILVHASALADPRVNAQFWADWNDFEARPPARASLPRWARRRLAHCCASMRGAPACGALGVCQRGWAPRRPRRPHGPRRRPDGGAAPRRWRTATRTRSARCCASGARWRPRSRRRTSTPRASRSPTRPGRPPVRGLRGRAALHLGRQQGRPGRRAPRAAGIGSAWAHTLCCAAQRACCVCW